MTDEGVKGCVHILYVWRATERSERPRSFRIQTPSVRFHARCDTLPPPIVERIRAGWKECGSGLSALARIAFEVVDEADAPRLVYVTTERGKRPKSLPTVKPLDVRFEPKALGGVARPLLRLMMEDPEVERAVRRAATARIVGLLPILLVLPGLVLFWWLAIVSPSWKTVALASFCTLFFGLGFAYVSAFMGRWYVVPGALVIQARSMLLMPTVKRHTPDDSILRIIQGRFLYNVIVQYKGGSHFQDRSKYLPEDQVAGLIAAWQSSLEPPSLEQCSDLR